MHPILNIEEAIPSHNKISSYLWIATTANARAPFPPHSWKHESFAKPVLGTIIGYNLQHWLI